ncbi:SDR family NAD(P)-dependent oxidoreductase [Altererythrobacter sp. MF3-039]|uniref:SDR family NAD(P)-dependent oxidoreductase n=1 Tax=Altererythrobacter sp. MF3-039 TaxID=3252901 RepID=UPI00390C4C37
MSEFRPRSAVITGGASGIGLAVARKLADGGTRVMLADLPGDRLDEAAASIKGALALPCDVSNLSQVQELADAAFDQLGSVELLFNNAGIGGPHGKMWEVSPDEARAHFEVNFYGVWNGCHAFIPRMIEQDRPSAIYNTGSENSWFCAVPRTAAYIAAKHAVLGMTESLREDLPDHVHAGLVIPGWVHTAIGEDRFMKYGMHADEFAGIIVPQMLARERFVVAHAYNAVRVHERIAALDEAFEKYAPRYEGDDEYDVKSVFAKLRAARD